MLLRQEFVRAELKDGMIGVAFCGKREWAVKLKAKNISLATGGWASGKAIKEKEWHMGPRRPANL